VQQGFVVFRQNDNTQYNINEGSLIQLTNSEKEKRMSCFSKKLLKTQQEELFQFVRDQEALKKWNAEKLNFLSQIPKPYFFMGKYFGGLKMDPKGNYTFRLLEEVEGKREKWRLLLLQVLQ
jgi:hypothetical protein